MASTLAICSKPRVEIFLMQELLEGNLHGMIGVWPRAGHSLHQTADVTLEGYLNYFENGWSHRDVSVGNVMLLKEHVVREPFIQ